MPRHRKPTAILEATGAFAKDPQRRRAREHEPVDTRPIGDPPDYFDEGHAAAWYELCAAVQPGVLAMSDRLHLELTVRLLVRFRRSPPAPPRWLNALAAHLRRLGWNEHAVDEFRDTIYQALKITPNELRNLTSCLSSMGMTPADRPRVHVSQPQKAPDPFDDALARLRQTRN